MKVSDPNGESLYNPDGWGCGSDLAAVLLVLALVLPALVVLR